MADVPATDANNVTWQMVSTEALPFQEELSRLINRHSQENGSNTPDFILAAYLRHCLEAFNAAVNAREQWYGRASRRCPNVDCNNGKIGHATCAVCGGVGAV